MVDYLVGLIGRMGQWGYLVIFAGALLESAAMLGVFVPGEALVLAAGFFAAQGALDLDALILTVALGAAIGDSLGYELGRRWGRDALVQYGGRVGVTQRRLERVDAFFTRRGGSSVFLGRFVGFARALVPFLAGSSRMPYRRFLAYNVAGAVLWSIAIVLLGYFVGASWQAAEAWIGRISGSLLALLGLGLLFRFRHRLRGVVPWDIAVVVIAICLFGAITEDVVTKDPLTILDVRLSQWWELHRIPALTPAVIGFTSLHNPLPLTGLALLIGIFLLLKRDLRWLATLVITVLGGSLVNYAFKHVIQRARPSGEGVGLVFHTFSFPSGHVSGATLIYGFLAAYVVAHEQSTRTRSLAVAAALVMVMLVALSRMYVGAHFLSDVLAAFAESLAWLSLCLMALQGRLSGRTWQYFESRTKTELQHEHHS